MTVATTLEKIKTRGYWHVTISPGDFLTNRVEDFSQLEVLVRESAVALRGWDYPHFDLKSAPVSGHDYIEQATEWQNYLEVWRMYQSGQFVHVAGFRDDWRDLATMWGAAAEPGWQPGVQLHVYEVVYRVWEVFELSARLARTVAGGETMRVRYRMASLRDRELTIAPHRAPLFARKVTLSDWEQELILSLDELLGGVREIATRQAIEFFKRCGWSPEPRIIREIQDELNR